LLPTAKYVLSDSECFKNVGWSLAQIHWSLNKGRNLEKEVWTGTGRRQEEGYGMKGIRTSYNPP